MRYIIIGFLLACGFGLFQITVAYADTSAQNEGLNMLKNVGTSAKYDTSGNDKSLAKTVGNIIAMSLGLLGVIFLAFTVFAGYLYLTAGGDEEKIKTAIGYIKNAVIGLVIVLSAYGITKWVVNAVVQSTFSGPSPTTPGVTGG